MKSITIRCPDCRKLWKVTGLTHRRRSVVCPNCQRMVVLASQIQRSDPTEAAAMTRSDIAFWGSLSGVGVLALGLATSAVVFEKAGPVSVAGQAPPNAVAVRSPLEIHNFNPNRVPTEAALTVNPLGVPSAEVARTVEPTPTPNSVQPSVAVGSSRPSTQFSDDSQSLTE